MTSEGTTMSAETILTVDVAEAQTRLPELLARVAAGERFVVTDDGRPAAMVGPPPPPPPTPEEIAASQARAKESIKQMVRWQIEAGRTPPPECKIWELFTPEELSI